MILAKKLILQRWRKKMMSKNIKILMTTAAIISFILLISSCSYIQNVKGLYFGLFR